MKNYQDTKSIELSYEIIKLAEAINTQQIINWPKAKKMKEIFANKVLNLLNNEQ